LPINGAGDRHQRNASGFGYIFNSHPIFLHTTSGKNINYDYNTS
jgi:hypothetical protein